jgi:arylsulfatase A-like enzyme
MRQSSTAQIGFLAVKAGFMSVSAPGLQTKDDSGSWKTRLSAFFRREFGRPEPTGFGELVIVAIGVSATVGLIAGVWNAATAHFLDPALVGYTIAVDVCVQIVILVVLLALAFITRRRPWLGALFAIGVLCLLEIPELVKLALPGADYWVRWCIAALAAFQIVRTVNRQLHTRTAAWMIGVPALAAVCAFSFGPLREHSQLSALPNQPNSPNVLVIIVDTLRADHLSTYGYQRDSSPYLTHLAQQGVVFDNAISTSSWTLPSHASMLTGLYPHESKMEQGTDILSGNLPNLGDAMRKRGYRTAAFSANYKFFTRGHGFIHGFSHFEGYEQNLAGILETVHLSRFILEKISHFTTGVDYAYLGHKNWASAEQIDKIALHWMGKERRPFFVVLNYTDVHEPVLPPEPYLHRYTSDPKARIESMHFQDRCLDVDPKASCTSDQQQFIDAYDGSMRYVDESIQHLLAQLNEQGQLRNTILVFTSDHGQEFGDHGIYGHAKSLFRPEIQVPLFFWNPGLVPAAVRVQTPVSTSAIPATILDLVAPADKQPLPGRSLATLWRSSNPVSDWPDAISELPRFRGFDTSAPNYNTSLQSIVTSEWHYVHQEGKGKKDMLFDWKNDPGETKDLSAAQPDVCTGLRTRIQAAEGSPPQVH